MKNLDADLGKLEDGDPLVGRPNGRGDDEEIEITEDDLIDEEDLADARDLDYEPELHDA